MTAFVLLYIYIFFIWIVSNTKKDDTSKRRFQCVASAIGLIFLLAFHSPTLGCDIVGSYVPAFERTGKDFVFSIDDSIYGFELGFMNYMVLIHHITNDVQVFLIISSFIIVIPIIYLFYLKSTNVMFSVLIYTSWYLYYFSFSGLRQCLAISICVIASVFVFKRKIIPFILLVLLASFFHTSAMFFLLAYALYNYKIRTRKILFIGVILLIVLTTFKNTMLIVADIVFGVDNKYSSHLSSTEYGGVTIAIVYFIFMLYQMYVSKKDNKYISFLMLLTIIQTTGMYSQVIPRLAYYFIPFFALSFPEALHSLPQQKRLLAQTSLLFVFIAFFLMQANSHYLDVTPFKFFWE